MRGRISLRHSLPLTLGTLVVLATGVVLWRFSVRLPTALSFLQNYWDVILIGVLGFSFLLVILWKVPKWQVSHALNIQDRLAAENAARQTLAQIIGGAVLLVGLFFTWANLNIAQENIKITQDTATKSQDTATKNLELAQEGQITDRFTKAIAQLGDEKMAVRLGGIYALERIAKGSEKDHWPIMEVLTAYVRERVPWVPKDAPSSEGHQPHQEALPAPPTPPLPKLAADIQAILTVLGRRSHTSEKGVAQRLDLTSTDLHGANLWGAQLQGAELRGAQLQGAILLEAQLQGADLWDAQLGGARLWDAQLQEASLWDAQLQAANFERAQLQGASLRGAQLQGASLWDAQLQGANFEGAQLQGADLTGANLEGAHDLTVEQLAAVKTLYNAHLDPPLLEQIRQQYPQLLEIPRK